MNNIEKKLDALIDALGFDVEEVETPVKVTSYEASKPAVMIERTLYNNSYKLTKKSFKAKPSLHKVVRAYEKGTMSYDEMLGRIALMEADYEGL